MNGQQVSAELRPHPEAVTLHQSVPLPISGRALEAPDSFFAALPSPLCLRDTHAKAVSDDLQQLPTSNRMRQCQVWLWGLRTHVLEAHCMVSPSVAATR